MGTECPESQAAASKKRKVLFFFLLNFFIYGLIMVSYVFNMLYYV